VKRPNIYAEHALLERHATLAGEMQASNGQYGIPQLLTLL
jgi:hypothetical protein